MTDLAEFLLARIADEEEAWRGGTDLSTRPDFAKLARHMLADCEAKRRIVALAREQSAETSGDYVGWQALLLLALPYADHPDYREEWKP